MVKYSKDATINEAIEQMISRANAGMEKFGIPIEDAEGDVMHWLEEGICEANDLLVYLVRLRRKLKLLHSQGSSNTVPKCTCADCIRGRI